MLTEFWRGKNAEEILLLIETDVALTITEKFLISSHTTQPFLKGNCSEVHFVIKPTVIWTYIPKCSGGKFASRYKLRQPNT